MYTTETFPAWHPDLLVKDYRWRSNDTDAAGSAFFLATNRKAFAASSNVNTLIIQQDLTQYAGSPGVITTSSDVSVIPPASVSGATAVEPGIAYPTVGGAKIYYGGDTGKQFASVMANSGGITGKLQLATVSQADYYADIAANNTDLTYFKFSHVARANLIQFSGTSLDGPVMSYIGFMDNDSDGDSPDRTFVKNLAPRFMHNGTTHTPAVSDGVSIDYNPGAATAYSGWAASRNMFIGFLDLSTGVGDTAAALAVADIKLGVLMQGEAWKLIANGVVLTSGTFAATDGHKRNIKFHMTANGNTPSAGAAATDYNGGYEVSVVAYLQEANYLNSYTTTTTSTYTPTIDFANTCFAAVADMDWASINGSLGGTSFVAGNSTIPPLLHGANYPTPAGFWQNEVRCSEEINSITPYTPT
jgi:hypothetical protein